MSDPRMVAGWLRVFRELFPPERIQRERRVDIAITGDGGVWGSQVRGPLSDEATPVVDAEQVPAPDGSGYANAKDLFDALIAAAATYVDVAGDTMTGPLVIQDDLTVTGDSALGDGDADTHRLWGHVALKAGAPSVAVGSALGTGGSVSASLVWGNDQVGEIQLVAGTTGLGTGTAATITFATARPNTNYAIVLDNLSNGASINAVQRGPRRSSASAWTIDFRVAPTAGVTYTYDYLIVEAA